MPDLGRRSIASGGVVVDYRWYACSVLGEHIAQTVDALFEAIRKPGHRRWNPWTIAATRAEFQHRLRMACCGELIPIDEVKEITGAYPAIMFEIRWQDINVNEFDAVAGVGEFSTVSVRLLYGEPQNVGLVIIGLHAHEKAIFPTERETRATQDEQISVAEHRYWLGMTQGFPIS